MGEEVNAFLSWLATDQKVSASTQNQALGALLFLYRHVENDLHAGFGAVWIPEAIERKIPSAARAWGWQWMFPASSRWKDETIKTPMRVHLPNLSARIAFSTCSINDLRYLSA